MSTTIPTLRYGRLPGRVPVGLHDLTHYAAGSLPTPPPSMVVPAITDWGMLGNDRFGDCGVAGLAHLLMAAAAMAAAPAQTWPTADEVVSYYLKYTHGQDSGVVLADFLAYVRKAGFFGRSVTAFAPVAVSDLKTIQTAAWAYDGVYGGIEVTQRMEEEFAAGKAWTLESLRSPVAGGHCVPIVGYDSLYAYVLTWGKVQPVAWGAWQHMASEAWAVISSPLAKGDGHGLALAQLVADLDALDQAA